MSFLYEGLQVSNHAHEISLRGGGGVASLQGIVCAMCMCGTRKTRPLKALSFASVSASSLPSTPECVQTLVL